MSESDGHNAFDEHTVAQLRDGKAWLEGLIGAAMDAIVAVDEQGRVLVFNRAAETMFRRAAAEVIGQPISVLCPDLDLGEEKLVETIGLRPDGKEFRLEASVTRLQTSSSHFLTTLIIRDVTEREAVLEELRHRELELNVAQRVTHVGSWNWDLTKDEMTWSEELFRIYGLEPAELAPNYSDIKAAHVHEEDRQYVDDALNYAFATGNSFDFVHRLIRPDGEIRYLRARGEGVLNDEGKAVRFFGTALDITDQQVAEQNQQKLLDELLAHDIRFKDFIAHVPGIVWESVRNPDSTDRLTFVSDYIEQMLGYTTEEWMALPDMGASVIHPVDRERIAIEALDQYKTGNDNALEFRWTSKSGELRWARSKSRMILDPNGVPIGRRGVTIDITDRKLAEAAMQDTAQRYRLLFAASPLPMWVYDRSTLRFLEVNEAAVRTYGYSRDEFLGMTILQIRPDAEAERLRRRMEESRVSFADVAIWTHRKKDGSLMTVEISADSIEFNGVPARLVLANDISERQHLEDQLRQAQKMEAIGMLAGGIAHDFNNLLTAITGYSELLQRSIPASDPSRVHVDEILKAGNRAATLTSQLLAFGRKQVLQPRVVDLNEVVQDLENMLKRLVTPNIVLQTALADGLGSTMADPGQIEQAIVNLVVNARDAMPNGGRLTIETKNVYLDAEYARTHVSVEPGHYVMISVSDSGIGMDAETRERIFEPFFSTKEPGRGTGLGLSTTFGIVKQTGGNIWVYSEPGKGSTFKIYLPATGDSVERTSAKLEKMFDDQGTETVLVAEDEKSVRELTVKVLEMHGYRVFAAASGSEAIDISERFADKIDLLVTDVVMPGMSGGELAEKVTASRPAIKVLFMSGYTDNAVLHSGALNGDANFIQKPFSTGGFARRIREILDRA